MKQRRFKLKRKLNLYILIPATIIYCLAIGYISFQLKEITYSESIEIVKTTTRENRNKISEHLNVIMESARTLRNIFSTHKKYELAQRDAFFENILLSSLEKNPDFLSVGLYWEMKTIDPKYNKKNGRRRSIYFRASNEIKLQKEIVDTTNTALKGIYYTARSLNREMLWDPYYDVVTKELAGTLMTALFVPVQDPSGHFEGLVGIDITLAEINKLISGVKPFEESTTYILGGNRIIVAHTDQSLTGKNFLGTLFADSTKFKDGFKQIANHSSASFTYINSKNKEEYFVSFEPIMIGNNPSNWIVGIEVPTRIILKDAKNVLITAIISGLFGLILLYVIIYFIASRLSDPIVQGVDFAKKIAAGDLSAKLLIKQDDEIGDLANSLSGMASKLTTIMSEIIHSSEIITDRSIELMDSSVKLSNGANNQAAATEEISSTMEQMLIRIQKNTRSAQETEKIALKAAMGIQEGNEATKNLILSMNNIVQKISIVGEIAKQTNLLAINAAIEASRYGIQGKGFAVVAAEVKKLAEKSQLAAKEINELSTLGLIQARETGEKLLEIIPDIEQTAMLVKEIAASSMDQKLSSEEINNGIKQLNKVTQQNAESSFGLSINSKEMSKQAANLKKLISYFRI